VHSERRRSAKPPGLRLGSSSAVRVQLANCDVGRTCRLA
jgi:hypothetical protein